MLPKVSLFVLSVWLALPMLSVAADGESCASGTAPSGVTCFTICDKAAAGAFTCEFNVGNKGKNLDRAVIRVYKGTSAAGCGYDDVSVYEVSDTNGSETGFEKPSLGSLDDDGSSSGVKQIIMFGPIGPFLYLSGTADDAGALTCDADNELHIQLLLYHKQQP